MCIIVHLNFFAANIPALKDIWIVGDQFLRDTFDALQMMRNNTVTNIDPKTQLYIYAYYNVVLHFPGVSNRVKSLMARIINAMIKGLNSKEKLPKYLVVFIDKDLIEALDYFEYGITEALDECMLWMVKQTSRLFEIRHEDIRLKKPGV